MGMGWNGIPIPIRNPMGISMGMGIDDTTGNGNWKKWESHCMGMEMALIPMGINFQCLSYVKTGKRRTNLSPDSTNRLACYFSIAIYRYDSSVSDE